jgi:hypothetical protein
MIFLGHTRKGCSAPDHSEREWQTIIRACAFRCFYCAEILWMDDTSEQFNPPTKDHLVPLFRGGCGCRGNLVSSCRRCNSMKKDKTVAEFLGMKPGLVATSGRFYTRISLLKPICAAKCDPLLNAVRRMAVQKRFPDVPSYREPQPASLYWRTGA